MQRHAVAPHRGADQQSAPAAKHHCRASCDAALAYFTASALRQMRTAKPASISFSVQRPRLLQLLLPEAGSGRSGSTAVMRSLLPLPSRSTISRRAVHILDAQAQQPQQSAYPCHATAAQSARSCPACAATTCAPRWTVSTTGEAPGRLRLAHRPTKAESTPAPVYTDTKSHRMPGSGLIRTPGAAPPDASKSFHLHRAHLLRMALAVKQG